MFRLRINRTLRRQLFVWLTTLGLLMRAVVPDGYMPNQIGDGEGLIFQLCSTNGIKRVQFDFATGEYIELASSSEHDDDQHAAPCPYSISLLAFTAPLQLEFFYPAYQAVFAQSFNIRAPPPLHALPPLPARGPPGLLRLTS